MRTVSERLLDDTASEKGRSAIGASFLPRRRCEAGRASCLCALPSADFKLSTSKRRPLRLPITQSETFVGLGPRVARLVDVQHDSGARIGDACSPTKMLVVCKN